MLDFCKVQNNLTDLAIIFTIFFIIIDGPIRGYD